MILVGPGGGLIVRLGRDEFDDLTWDFRCAIEAEDHYTKTQEIPF